MPRRRTLTLQRLKPSCVSEYVRLHHHVWPELEAAYRKAGITQIASFLDGRDLAVLVEYEEERYAEARAELDSSPLEVRWQAMMSDLRDPDFVRRTFDQVYALSEGEETAP